MITCESTEACIAPVVGVKPCSRPLPRRRHKVLGEGEVRVLATPQSSAASSAAELDCTPIWNNLAPNSQSQALLRQPIAGAPCRCQAAQRDLINGSMRLSTPTPCYWLAQIVGQTPICVSNLIQSVGVTNRPVKTCCAFGLFRTVEGCVNCSLCFLERRHLQPNRDNHSLSVDFFGLNSRVVGGFILARTPFPP
ncbi:hypothetical protein VTJ04DRAFT_5448 [Mycothermus thermophilus]|uniref:uncharacterized protein n=1 Tax=Humicola insolens TaxID=85995 RepID=UPI00374344C9